MPLFARAMFGLVNWAARRNGLAVASTAAGPEERSERRRTGLRGETFAYWYLRQLGYVVVRRNYRVPHRHGEIDLIGWDGPVLAFVEVKTRTTATGGPPEEAMDRAKQQEIVSMARDYLRRAKLADSRCRFDVVAIEARTGAAPVVRLHKGAFGAH
jgi:putative endonuclease